MKKAIKVTSAMTNQKLFLDVEEVAGVEGVEGARDAQNAKAKIYTKTKGNFYVNEPAEPIAQQVFENIK